jgi:hypothetical protein
MRDVIVLAIIAGFFLLCVAYVRWCDHIIGPDPDDLRDTGEDPAHDSANVPAVTAVATEPAFDAEAAVRQ